MSDCLTEILCNRSSPSPWHPDHAVEAISPPVVPLLLGAQTGQLEAFAKVLAEHVTDGLLFFCTVKQYQDPTKEAYQLVMKITEFSPKFKPDGYR